jgi:hypothetical protein
VDFTHTLLRLAFFIAAATALSSFFSHASTFNERHAERPAVDQFFPSPGSGAPLVSSQFGPMSIVSGFKESVMDRVNEILHS